MSLLLLSGITLVDWLCSSSCWYFLPVMIISWWVLSFNSHRPLMTHIFVSELGQHWFRWRLVAYWAPSHYLNICWVIGNWIFRNKLQWNFSQNIKFSIHEKASEKTVFEMAATLSRGRSVNTSVDSCVHKQTSHYTPRPERFAYCCCSVKYCVVWYRGLLLLTGFN